MVQWGEHLPATNVALVQFPQTRSHSCVKFVVNSSPCSEFFSLGPLVVLPYYRIVGLFDKVDL